LTSLPSFNQVKGIDIPIKSIPAMKPPKILELEEVFVPESLSESEDPPPLDEDPPSKSSASENDDSASASNSTKFLP
jgi:hypothetical protein